jgi:hypothetical protein
MANAAKAERFREMVDGLKLKANYNKKLLREGKISWTEKDSVVTVSIRHTLRSLSSRVTGEEARRILERGWRRAN